MTPVEADGARAAEYTFEEPTPIGLQRCDQCNATTYQTMMKVSERKRNFLFAGSSSRTYWGRVCGMCAQLAGRALTDDEVEAHQRISAEIPSQDAVASVWTDLGMAVREVPGGRPTTRSEVDAFFGSVMRAAEQRRSHSTRALRLCSQQMG